jgi:enamine deaminase RidA (YjgF/YER057c/UK114 family)
MLFRRLAQRPSRFMASAALHTERKLAELGHKLPTPAKPVAAYVMSARVGNLIYTAGHLPQPADGPLITGKVRSDGRSFALDTSDLLLTCDRRFRSAKN